MIKNQSQPVQNEVLDEENKQTQYEHHHHFPSHFTYLVLMQKRVTNPVRTCLTKTIMSIFKRIIFFFFSRPWNISWVSEPSPSH